MRIRIRASAKGRRYECFDCHREWRSNLRHTVCPFCLSTEVYVMA